MMDEKFKELLLKKWKAQGEKPVEGEKMAAKAEMADKLAKLLQSDLADGMKSGMQKVSIASDSPEGLKKGLEMAQSKVDKIAEMSEEGEDSEQESESEDSEIEELEKKLAELKAKKGMC